MNEFLNFFLPTTSILILLLLLSVAVFRIPITSTKISFGFFCFFFLIWNFIELAQNFKLFEQRNSELMTVLSSLLTIYSSVVVAVHFPFYRRREVVVNVLTSFLGGMGFFSILLVLSTPYIRENFPLESKFYLSINLFIVKAYSLLGLISCLSIIIYKLTLSSDNFKKYSYRVISYFIIALSFLLLLNYFLTLEERILKSVININLLDTIFLIFFFVSLIQFKFFSFYPGVLSILLYREIPKLIIQKEAPSNIDGAKYLKEELWKIYEAENWKAFLNEFWFSIIIDETLDNAVEHGGRRWEDMVTVQVFETSKFIDLYVIDAGKGFEPTKLPDPRKTERKSIPSGRGIHIMKQLFEVSWNFLGNEIKVRVSKDPKKNPQEN